MSETEINFTGQEAKYVSDLYKNYKNQLQQLKILKRDLNIIIIKELTEKDCVNWVSEKTGAEDSAAIKIGSQIFNIRQKIVNVFQSSGKKNYDLIRKNITKIHKLKSNLLAKQYQKLKLEGKITQEIKNHIVESCRKYDQDPAEIYKLIYIESKFNSNVESNTGAKGLTQLFQGAIANVLEQIFNNSTANAKTSAKYIYSDLKDSIDQQVQYGVLYWKICKEEAQKYFNKKKLRFSEIFIFYNEGPTKAKRILDGVKKDIYALDKTKKELQKLNPSPSNDWQSNFTQIRNSPGGDVCVNCKQRKKVFYQSKLKKLKQNINIIPAGSTEITENIFNVLRSSVFKNCVGKTTSKFYFLKDPSYDSVLERAGITDGKLLQEENKIIQYFWLQIQADLKNSKLKSNQKEVIIKNYIFQHGVILTKLISSHHAESLKNDPEFKRFQAAIKTTLETIATISKKEDLEAIGIEGTGEQKQEILEILAMGRNEITDDGKKEKLTSLALVNYSKVYRAMMELYEKMTTEQNSKKKTNLLLQIVVLSQFLQIFEEILKNSGKKYTELNQSVVSKFGNSADFQSLVSGVTAEKLDTQIEILAEEIAEEYKTVADIPANANYTGDRNLPDDRQKRIEKIAETTTGHDKRLFPNLPNNLRQQIELAKKHILVGNFTGDPRINGIIEICKNLIPHDKQRFREVRQFIFDLLEGGKKAPFAFSPDKILGKFNDSKDDKSQISEKVLARLKKQNYIFSAAVLELADQARKNIIVKNGKFETDDLLDARPTAIDPGKDYNYAGAKSLAGKSLTWIGATTFYGVKYGALLTVFFNGVVSVNSAFQGEPFFSPYILGGAAAFHIGTNVFTSNIVDSFLHPENRIFNTMQSLLWKSKEKGTNVLRILADKNEQKVLKNIVRQENWKKTFEELQKEKRKVWRESKKGKTFFKKDSAFPRYNSEQIEVFPKDLLEKFLNSNARILSGDHAEKNRARYQTLSFLAAHSDLSTNFQEVIRHAKNLLLARHEDFNF